MEIRPWYLMQPKCPDCQEPHEYGPFKCKQIAVDYGEAMADKTDQLLSELTVEDRAPLTDDQINEAITEKCCEIMSGISQAAIVAKLTGGEAIEDPRTAAISVILSVIIDIFEDFRPGSTVTDVKNVFVGYEEDTIGGVSGHA